MPDEPGRGFPAIEPRRLMAAYLVAAILVAVIVAAVVVALTAGPRTAESPSAPGDPFSAHYDGLEERRTAAGVPTMAEGGGEHFHPLLEVYVRGERIPVPANIGIDPAQPPAMMAGLHTHDESGTIHNEAGTGSTLGQFFEIWGVELSRSRLGPYEADGNERVRMWVDGRASEAFHNLMLADGQRIIVTFGTQAEAPPGLE